MKQPLITVIIPSYNCGATIYRCIDSVVHQKYANLEIIIVLKKSNDKTVEEISKFNDSRIKIVDQLDNSGAGGARNIGLRLAHGEYIGFVEADDFIDPDFYEELYTRLKDSENDVAFAETKNKHGEIITYHQFPSELSTLSEKLTYIKNGATFDKLFRADFLRKYRISFAEGIRWEDNIFILKVIYFSKNIALVKNTYYHYITESWSREYKEVLRKDSILMVKEIMAFARGGKFTRYEMRLLKSFIYKSFASSFIYDNALYGEIVNNFGWSLSLAFKHYRAVVKSFKEKRNAYE